jgi:hypothetical protein
MKQQLHAGGTIKHILESCTTRDTIFTDYRIRVDTDETCEDETGEIEATMVISTRNETKFITGEDVACVAGRTP